MCLQCIQVVADLLAHLVILELHQLLSASLKPELSVGISGVNGSVYPAHHFHVGHKKQAQFEKGPQFVLVHPFHVHHPFLTTGPVDSNPRAHTETVDLCRLLSSCT